MTDSKISWTTKTWNPTTGCDQVSPGCDHCYALTLAARLQRMGNPRYQNDGSPKTSGPGFALTLHEDKIEEPLKWRKPARVFVNSMSDLFHDDVPPEFIAKVFGIMQVCHHLQFQILTKRPRRMQLLMSDITFQEQVDDFAAHHSHYTADWPLPNVWLGTSVEDQKRANLRIPLLLKTPAAVRFLSCEPLLGPLNLHGALGWEYDAEDVQTESVIKVPVPPVDWVIVGGESGPNHRPMNIEWARTIRDQCVAAGVPFFYKQGSGRRSEMHKELDGRTWEEMPDVA